MTMWNPPSGNGSGNSDRDEYQRRITAQAAHDAFVHLDAIWNREIPDGNLMPIAIEFTKRYIARLRQESAAIPRWAFTSEKLMRFFIQDTGDRYCDAFLNALSEYFGHRMRTQYRVPPRTTPRLRSLSTPNPDPGSDSAPSFPTPPPPQRDERGA